MRNWLSSYIANEIQNSDEWNPSYEFVDLFLNGEYVGNYILAEAIQINDNRINVNGYKNLEKIKETNKYSEGVFVLEIDFRRDSKWWFDSAVCHIPFTLKDPDFDDLDEDSVSSYVNYIKEVIDNIETNLSADDFSTKSLEEIWYPEIKYDVVSDKHYYVLKKRFLSDERL